MNKQMKFVFFFAHSDKNAAIKGNSSPKVEAKEKIRTELFLFLN